MDVHFENAWVLYLLWLVPGAALWWGYSVKARERRLAQLVSPPMQTKLRPVGSRARDLTQVVFAACALFLFLLSAARPQWGTLEQVVYQRGRDLVIALDVSRSMLATDVRPNRMQRAKADVLDLIGELRGDRAALLAFRAKGIVVCPLTTDYAYLRQALDGIDIDSAPRGETDIGAAISRAMTVFESDAGAHKAIVLISDGEDLTGKAVTAAEQAGQKGIPIFTVGLGSPSGSRIPSKERNGEYITYQGQEVTTRLEHETLRQIAARSGGAYIPVGTSGTTDTTLGVLYRNHLRNIAARDLEESLQRRRVERYQIFLLPAVLLLMATAFLSRGRLRARSGPLQDGEEMENGPSRPPAAPLLLFCISFVSATAGAEGTNSAQPIPPLERRNLQQETVSTNASLLQKDIPAGRSGARVAQSYYRRGEYVKAAAAYMEAAKEATSEARADFKYNAAVSYFHAKDYQKAADVLRDLAATENNGRAITLKALGATLYALASSIDAQKPAGAKMRADLLDESGKAFQEALRIAPDDQEARYSLATIAEKLPGAQHGAEVARLMDRYKQTSADDLLKEMMGKQRGIVQELPAAFSNDTPARIQELESLSRRQRENADLWIPLKGKLLEEAQRGTNQLHQLDTLETMVEASRESMLSAAENLRDLQPRGHVEALAAQGGVYRLWKAFAGYPSLLKEAIRRQTNAISMNPASKKEPPQGKDVLAIEQKEVKDLSGLFRERFARSPVSAGPPTSQQPNDASTDAGDKNPATPSTGGKAITPEDRDNILELSDQAVVIQENALKAIDAQLWDAARTNQVQSHAILKEIEKLLPKQEQPPQSSQQGQQQQQKSTPDSQQQEKTPQKPRQQKQADDSNAQPESPRGEESEQPQPKEEKKDQKLNEQELRSLLEKALQREKEHEARKREQNRSIPLPSHERDW